MLGTFKPGDRIITEKIPIREIIKGDLVIFDKPDAQQRDFIVHRVVKVTVDSLVTRGDHCRLTDQDPVTEATFIGRVKEFDREGMVLRPRNGRKGSFHSQRIRLQMLLTDALKSLLKKPYRRLRKSGIVARIWHPDLETLRFDTSAGALIKFIHHGKTVASFWQNEKRWSFSRPYDLLIDTKQGKEYTRPIDDIDQRDS